MAASFVYFTILLTMPLANWSITGTLAQPGVLTALVKAGQLTSQDQGIIPVCPGYHCPTQRSLSVQTRGLGIRSRLIQPRNPL